MGKMKTICMRCYEPIDSETSNCEDCGSENIVWGSRFSIKDGGVVCDCDGGGFSMVTHINSDPYFTKSYSCIGCGNTVGIQAYYNKED